MKTEKICPRPEYPRPQFVRENWRNLNGIWEFTKDMSNSGEARKLYQTEKLSGEILVPFCPEAKLSGIGDTDFIPAVWYAKNFEINTFELQGKILVHFGACDYRTKVFVNGEEVGEHIGGFTSFSFDITDFVKEGGNRLVVYAQDDVRTGKQPAGKQCNVYTPYGCLYTRTTGIWQTVWLEFVPNVYLKKVKITATNLNGNVIFEPMLNIYAQNTTLKTEIFFENKLITQAITPLSGQVSQFAVTVKPVSLWDVGAPNLYDVQYTLFIDGEKVDEVISYFGIRRIDIDGYRVRINGKSVFQRLVLDQGFYREGLYTAPTDEALKKDIELSMRLGFNGARLHEKVFEERFLYHADKAGYLVWGEFPNWGFNYTVDEALHIYLPEWLESIERDYNHPSIIGWCPYNETWDVKGRPQIDTNISLVALVTKTLDNTRPVIDTSGWMHTSCTDIYDVHDYEQKPEIFEKHYLEHAEGNWFNVFEARQAYDGKKPYFVSEYGGMKWSQETGNAWGYGETPTSVEEFVERFCRLTCVLMQAKNIFGFCYTQLYDIEQEQNGLYYYDRQDKFTEETYRKISETITQKAAIED